MKHDSLANERAGSYSKHQQLFLGYTLAVLVDVTVLHPLSEYWDRVLIEFFTISLFAAVLFQFLLQVTIASACNGIGLSGSSVDNEALR